MTKRIVVIPDLQVPYHDPKAVLAVQQFVGEYEPDELMCVGDEADSPEPSRWSKGYAEEYAPTLQKGLDATAKIMAEFRQAVGDVPFHVQRSNHTDRISTYVSKYAPALASLRELDYYRLVGYHEIGVEFHKQLFEFAPGWVMAHGDEGGSSRLAGGTALSLARAIGKSVVCGHTHKAALVHDHPGFNGRTTRLLFGFEVGNLMDMRQASYLARGAANWQQAFGIFYVDGNKVTPHLVPIIGKQFVVEGQVYSWS